MKLKHFIYLCAGLLVGFLGLNQFYSYQIARSATSRDTNVTYANQLNLTVKTNEKLKTELSSLENQLTELRTAANIYQVLDKDIARFELLLGKKSVTGPGIELTIDAPLETFWIIDIVNELYVSGAETISINGNRFGGTMGFVSQGDANTTLYMNNQLPLSRPYVIDAIGDTNLLHQYLTQNEGIVPRITKALGLSKNAISIEKKESIVIPAAS